MARGRHRHETAERRLALERALTEQETGRRTGERPSRRGRTSRHQEPLSPRSRRGDTARGGVAWAGLSRWWATARTGPRWFLVGAVVLALVTSGAVVLNRSGGCDDLGTLNVVVAPDQFEVVHGAAIAWTPSPDRGCVRIRVHRNPSSNTAAGLAKRWNEVAYGPRPDVWMPDSALWLSTASLRPAAAAMLAGDGLNGVGRLGSVAASPVVMAAPRPMAEALGWPAKEASWTDLVRQRLSGRNWSRYQHPEWGQFRLGLPDPTRSTAALITLLPVLDKNDDGKLSATEQRDALLFSRAITDEAPETGAFFVRAGEAGPEAAALRNVALFPSTERDVVAYNQSEPGVEMVSVAPAEGLVMADYPYVVLDAPWVDEPRREAAGAFFDQLMDKAGQAAYRAAGFRGPSGGADGLGDRAGVLTNTPVAQRTLASSTTINETADFWSRLHRRANLLAVLDTSGSMARLSADGPLSRLQVLQQAAIRAVTLFRFDTRVGAWQFSTNLDGDRDYREIFPLSQIGTRTGDGTPRRQEAQRALLGLRPGGETGLYDTTLAAYRHLQERWAADHLNMVVIMTDGRNEDANSISRARLIAELRRLQDPERPIELIAVGYGPEVDQAELREITSVVGGQAFVATTADDIDRVFLGALLGR